MAHGIGHLARLQQIWNLENTVLTSGKSISSIVPVFRHVKIISARVATILGALSDPRRSSCLGPAVLRGSINVLINLQGTAIQIFTSLFELHLCKGERSASAQILLNRRPDRAFHRPPPRSRLAAHQVQQERAQPRQLISRSQETTLPFILQKPSLRRLLSATFNSLQYLGLFHFRYAGSGWIGANWR